MARLFAHGDSRSWRSDLGAVPVPVNALVAGFRAVFFFDPDVLRSARRINRDEIEPRGSTRSAR
jgi:hypothetical protein